MDHGYHEVTDSGGSRDRLNVFFLHLFLFFFVLSNQLYTKVSGIDKCRQNPILFRLL